MLQAESEKLRQAWIQAVQASIASAYKDIADNYYIEVGDLRVATNRGCPPDFLTHVSTGVSSAASGPDCVALHQQH